ncbi:hypothetical protein CBW65_03285 [Tumebacillus avium]|uniref:Uncharacterized protein n=1 Tax=Tumebacillus avium TaxID=1903704 RepID=A0A1Y0IIB1_9BACL|nr:hypothetical protein [Tumebacillus avium]ARU60187.1 hypothetical protein CBW65_03285 [Tumebacillus avium]
MDETQKLLQAILESNRQTNAAVAALTNRMDRFEANYSDFIENRFNRLENIVDEIVRTMATKEDLVGFATKEDLAGFATKEDLAGFATKEDLERFATKEDLAGFATKEDLEKFATKEDLAVLTNKIAGLATKEDVAMMTETCASREQVQVLENKFNETDKLHHLKHAYQDREIMIIKEVLSL